MTRTHRLWRRSQPRVPPGTASSLRMEPTCIRRSVKLLSAMRFCVGWRETTAVPVRLKRRCGGCSGERRRRGGRKAVEEDEAAAEAARRWAAAMVKSRSGGVRPGGPERGTDKVALVCRDEERRFFFKKKKRNVGKKQSGNEAQQRPVTIQPCSPSGLWFFLNCLVHSVFIPLKKKKLSPVFIYLSDSPQEKLSDNLKKLSLICFSQSKNMVFLFRNKKIYLICISYYISLFYVSLIYFSQFENKIFRLL